MASLGVVEPFEVVEQRQSRGLMRRKSLPAEQSAFQCREETLCHRVVETVPATPHRRHDPRFPQSRSDGETRVLAPLIRVMNHPGGGPTTQNRHRDRVADECGAQVIRHRPANNAPTIVYATEKWALRQPW